MAKKAKKSALAGEVCLYGNRDIGFGFIAALPGGKLFGDGEPAKHRSATDAYWLGLIELRDAGADGKVAIFDAGGERVAYVEAKGSWPYYGELKWEPAPMIVFSAEEIMKHAEPNV